MNYPLSFIKHTKIHYLLLLLQSHYGSRCTMHKYLMLFGRSSDYRLQMWRTKDREEVGKLRCEMVPLQRSCWHPSSESPDHPPPPHKKKRTVFPGDAFEDTASKPGFELSKSKPSFRVSALHCIVKWIPQNCFLTSISFRYFFFF
jgi:hypothetical protein